MNEINCYKQKIGKFGEILAEKYLIKNNYLILAKNIQTSYFEIDILAKNKEEIVFIEVKTRISLALGPANEALSRRKLRNFKRAVKYIALKRNYNLERVRLDFIAIDIDRATRVGKIKHYKKII